MPRIYIAVVLSDFEQCFEQNTTVDSMGYTILSLPTEFRSRHVIYKIISQHRQRLNILVLDKQSASDKPVTTTFAFDRGHCRRGLTPTATSHVVTVAAWNVDIDGLAATLTVVPTSLRRSRSGNCSKPREMRTGWRVLGKTVQPASYGAH